MPTYINNNSNWSEIGSVYTNVSGIWEEAQSIFVKDNGVWEEVYSAITLDYVTALYDNNTGYYDSASLGALSVRCIIPASEVLLSTTTNYIDLSTTHGYSLSNLTIDGVSVTFSGSNSVNVTTGVAVRSDPISVTLTAGQAITFEFDAGVDHPVSLYPGYAVYIYNYVSDSDIPWNWRYQGEYRILIESIVGY